LRAMRRLQGGLLISKVYVNCLVRNALHEVLFVWHFVQTMKF
jgi:hypothetical protein